MKWLDRKRGGKLLGWVGSWGEGKNVGENAKETEFVSGKPGSQRICVVSLMKKKGRKKNAHITKGKIPSLSF